MSALGVVAWTEAVILLPMAAMGDRLSGCPSAGRLCPLGRDPHADTAVDEFNSGNLERRHYCFETPYMGPSRRAPLEIGDRFLCYSATVYQV